MCYNKIMIDAHCHLKTPDCIFCTSEFLPQFYKGQEISSFENSSSEIGLDRRFTDKMSLNSQVKLLEKLLSLAKEKNKPVTLHCVHETEKMIETLKKANPKKGFVLWHGFTGSPETAAILYKLGVIVSIGPRFHGSMRSIAAANPLFVLETDYEGTDLKQHETVLEMMYDKAEKETAMQIQDLDSHCRNILEAFLFM